VIPASVIVNFVHRHRIRKQRNEKRERRYESVSKTAPETCDAIVLAGSVLEHVRACCTRCQRADSSIHYYFADQIGSANVVTNATGRHSTT
jgi:hypothetical protein